MVEREQKVEIREGVSAAITCRARGKPPPTYSWIKASTREVKHYLKIFHFNVLVDLC